MTKISKRPIDRDCRKPFSLHITLDGGYSIVDDDVDTVIAAIPYFMPKAASERATRVFLDAMNTFYQQGGYFPNFRHQ